MENFSSGRGPGSDIINERGYRTTRAAGELKKLGFEREQSEANAFCLLESKRFTHPSICRAASSALKNVSSVLDTPMNLKLI